MNYCGRKNPAPVGRWFTVSPLFTVSTCAFVPIRRFVLCLRIMRASRTWSHGKRKPTPRADAPCGNKFELDTFRENATCNRGFINKALDVL